MRLTNLSLLGVGTLTAIFLSACSNTMPRIASGSQQTAPSYLTPTGIPSADGGSYFDAEPYPASVAPAFNPPQFYRTAFQSPLPSTSKVSLLQYRI